MPLLDEPHAPTLGTLQDFARRNQKAEALKGQGMKYVLAKLDELNMRYCWTPGLRNKQRTNWGQVNAHIWRIRMMYHGGDCELANLPGAQPHQKLWEYRMPTLAK